MGLPDSLHVRRRFQDNKKDFRVHWQKSS